MVTPDTWTGFLDCWERHPDSPYVARLAVRDVELGSLVEPERPLRVVLTGGAGQLTGPVELCARRGWPLAVLDTALRDVDDPAGNARRVVTAAADLPDDIALHVRVPVLPADPTPRWLDALDVLAEAEAVVALSIEHDTVEHYLDAAMDRELLTSLVGGTPHRAVQAVRAAATLWGDPDDLAAGRRWVTSWLTDDAAAATAHLDAVSDR